jgi:uncharacterized protein YutE (UPF0331/DUF86 family)
MRSLLDVAADQGLVEPQLRGKLDEWMRVRNRVVHSAMEISRVQATELVNGVLGVINLLQ